jgi:hypothetical protein
MDPELPRVPERHQRSQLGLQAFRQAAVFGSQFHLMRPATEISREARTGW